MLVLKQEKKKKGHDQFNEVHSHNRTFVKPFGQMVSEPTGPRWNRLSFIVVQERCPVGPRLVLTDDLRDSREKHEFEEQGPQ